MDGNSARSWNYILLNGYGNAMSLPSCRSLRNTELIKVW